MQIYDPGKVKRIDTKYFDSAISELNTAINQYGNAKNKIVKATNNLLDCWEGKGYDKFNSAFKRLKKELEDHSDNLVTMRDDLQVILETYQTWDSENAASIAGNQTEEG